MVYIVREGYIALIHAYINLSDGKLNIMIFVRTSKGKKDEARKV